MFRKWLETNSAADFDLTTGLYPSPADRGFWGGRCDDRYITAAEKCMGYDWPVIRATEYMELKKSGSRIAQETPHFARRSVLCSLVMGEIAEYKGRFIPDIIDGMFAICEESFWGVSAHIGGMPTERTECIIDLFAAETASLLAMTCYLLKDELDAACPELTPRVERECRRRICDSYIDNTSYAWMGYNYPVNNWTPWIISNLLTVYLVFEKDTAILSRAVDKMLYEINTIYTTLPDDGGCDEGACYWAISGGCLFEFCEQLFVASGGRIDFLSDEKLRRICQFEYKVYLGGGYFTNFADGTPKMTHSVEGLFYMMGLRFGDDNFSALAKDIMLSDSERRNMAPEIERDAKIKRRLYEMIHLKDIESAPGLSLAETEYFDRTEIAIVRKDNWSIAAKGGHNAESHNHNDVGSFIAYDGSSPVLIDPSCGTYKVQSFSNARYELWTNNSAWHNVPEINGCLQEEGREFRADSFSLDGDTVRVSYAGAYPREASLRTAERDIFVADASVNICDRITLEGVGSVTEHFITPLSVRAEGDRVVIGEEYVLSCSAEAEIVLDSVDLEGDRKMVPFWKTDRMKRIAFVLDGTDAVDVTFTLERIQ